MAEVVVLGAGVMGSAMTLPVDANGRRTRLLGTHLDTEIVRSVAGNGFHPGLKVTLPASVRAGDWTDLGAALSDGPELVILGVSSAGVDWAIERLSETMTRPVSVLMITKGLAVVGGEITVLPHHVARELQGRLGFSVPVAAIAGPAIAGEQAAGRETSVIFTSTDMAQAAAARGMLANAGYHVTLSDDVVGVELCAALKNFFALGVGTAAGRFELAGEAPNGAAMHNLAASLFTLSIRELGELVRAMGGDPATVSGLAGVGDLYVTCRAGRNSRMGRLIGLDIAYSVAKADHMPDDTVEGAELALAIGPTLRAMMADGRLDPAALPLTRAIVASVCDDAPFPATLGALMAS